MRSASRDGYMSWLHFGDLHITDADQDNYRDFELLVEAANKVFCEGINFAYLPGDNADNGTPEQYQLVKSVADRLRLPVEVIPGDHDFEPGSLDNYSAYLAKSTLPQGVTIAGYRCLFLDLVSAGTGGPDFKLGETQRLWLERELAASDQQNLQAVLFMHTYPSDLGEEAPDVHALLRQHDVVAVDMGHTHYNELANDGRTIYMATRSTGQIEEGPVGFSVSAIDEGHVSWRFRALNHEGPFVLITSPADRRLTRDATEQADRDSHVSVHSSVWSADGVARVECRVGNGPWSEMQSLGEGSRWTISVDRSATRSTIEVRARDGKGACDTMKIETGALDEAAPHRHANGSDADHIGAWAEIGLCGTQLGPNRNGRKW